MRLTNEVKLVEIQSESVVFDVALSIPKPYLECGWHNQLSDSTITLVPSHRAEPTVVSIISMSVGMNILRILNMDGWWVWWWRFYEQAFVVVVSIYKAAAAVCFCSVSFYSIKVFNVLFFNKANLLWYSSFQYASMFWIFYKFCYIQSKTAKTCYRYISETKPQNKKV